MPGAIRGAPARRMLASVLPIIEMCPIGNSNSGVGEVEVVQPPRLLEAVGFGWRDTASSIEFRWHM